MAPAAAQLQDRRDARARDVVEQDRARDENGLGRLGDRKSRGVSRFPFRGISRFERLGGSEHECPSDFQILEAR